MAEVDAVEFSQFNIVVGDGGDPEVFTARCTVNLQRTFTITPSYNEIEIPDCDDDNLPSAIFRAMTSISAEAGGNGVMQAADAEFFSDWLLNNETKNVRVIVGTASAGRQWSFAAKLGPFSPSVEKNGVVTADISILSHGAISAGAVT